MRALTAAVIVLALTVGGCGDDGSDEGPADDFAASADAICADQARVELAAFADNVSFGEVGGAYLEEVEAARRAAAEDLAALAPPEPERESFDVFVAELERSADLAAEAVRAARADDSNAFEQVRLESREVRSAVNEAAEAAGLTDCAGSLSEDDLAEVEATLALTTDPDAAEELCRERATEALLVYRFDANADRCVREQSRGSGSGVDVEEVFGVGGLYANGVAILGDAHRYEFSLAFDDGAWKLNSLAAAP